MPRSPRTTRFLALGDSYTIGEGVRKEDRWPVQLVRELRRRGAGVQDPEIIAQTGWTTDELDAAIASRLPAGPFAMVSLQIGVNDQYRGRDAVEYEPHFESLLRQAITFAEGEPTRVLVLSIPDWGVTPYAEGRDRDRIRHAIDRFNAGSRRISLHGGVHWVDITTISRRAATDRSLLTDDGLHPSAAMYAMWVEAVLPVALGAVQQILPHAE